MTHLAPPIEEELLSSIIDAKAEVAQHTTLVTSRWEVLYIMRFSKITLVAAMACLLSLGAISYISDYSVNFQVVKNIMSMKTVFLHNQDSWRAIISPTLHHLSYWIIIIWQVAAAMFCWYGTYRSWRARKAPANVFHQAKTWAIAGLTLSLLMWIIAFLVIGSQWFLMWQSDLWNVQDTAFRMVAMTGIILVFLCLPEREDYLGYL